MPDDKPTPEQTIRVMAQECAANKGAMIVDIDVHADGTSHTHAVATWDDPGEGDGGTPTH